MAKLISKEEISEQVARLAQDILAYCKSDKIDTLTVIWIAEGAIFFVVDLLRHLESIDTEIISIKASSYGNGTTSSGTVNIIGELGNLEGKDVLLIDDILETGLTLKTISEKIRTLGVKSLKTCVLLDKNKANCLFKADFKCFDIENKFVYGYGLDLEKTKRNSLDIFYKE